MPRYRHPKLKLISNSKISGKKGTLTSDINCATGQWVLTTDADCKPDGPPNWIYDVMRTSGNYNVILLYGPYLQLPGFLISSSDMNLGISLCNIFLSLNLIYHIWG